ncbi:MAG: hypothetical protein U1F37_20285 [Alphaproteobacteria bacterium]
MRAINKGLSNALGLRVVRRRNLEEALFDRDRLRNERDALRTERDELLKQRDELLGSRAELLEQRDRLLKEQDLLAHVYLTTLPVLFERPSQRVHLKSGLKDCIFNSSVVVARNGGIFAVARSSTLADYRDGHFAYRGNGVHDTENVWFQLDSELRLLSERLLDDALLRQQCPLAAYGIEDMRLFDFNGEIYGIGAGISPIREIGPNALRVTQILVRIEDGAVRQFWTLPSPRGAGHEKNWTPVVRDGKLYLAYSLMPLVMIEFDQGGMSFSKAAIEGVNLAFALRGGSPFVEYGDKFVSLAHTPSRSIKNKLFYTHRFVLMNRDFEIVEISEEFFLRRRGIEFCAGLAPLGDGFLVSYGIADQAAAIDRLGLDEIGRFLAGRP